MSDEQVFDAESVTLYRYFYRIVHFDGRIEYIMRNDEIRYEDRPDIMGIRCIVKQQERQCLNV